MTRKNVNLVKEDLISNYLWAITICLHDKNIFLLNVDKNINTLLQSQELQQ